jgi:MFS family permease
MAVVAKATIGETRLRPAPAQLPTSDNMPRFVDVLINLWCQRSMRYLVVGYILFWTVGLGLTPWYAAFLMRSHAMSVSEVGLWFGLVVGITGIIAMLVGGYVVGRWLDHQEARQLRWAALMSFLLMPCFVLFLLLRQKHPALMALVPLVLVFNCFSGPIYALMQRLVPDSMRATTLAVVLLLSNLIGLGIGPQLVGILSDALAPLLGIDSLRYAMLAMSLSTLGAAYYFWKASGAVAQDLEHMHAPAPISLSTVIGSG